MRVDSNFHPLISTPDGCTRAATVTRGRVRRRSRLGGWIAMAAFFALAVTSAAPPEASAQVTVTLTSNNNPSTYLQAVTFTATVTPSSTTGSISFRDSSTFLATVALSGGAAQLVRSNLRAGRHTQITATFNGVPAVTSAPVSQLVYRATTSTSVSSDINPSKFGQNVRLTAALTPIGCPGRVFFYSNGNLIGTGGLNTTTGLATLLFNTLQPPGGDVTACYPGDNPAADTTENCGPSCSPPYHQVVDLGPTTIDPPTISPTTGAVCLQPVTLTTTVTPIFTTTVDVTGPVMFFINGNPVPPAAQAQGGVATKEVNPYRLPSNPSGSFTYTAQYLGNEFYAPSSVSAGAPQVVAKAQTSIAVTTDINPSFYGQSIRIRATGLPVDATGSVTFYDSVTTQRLGPLSVSASNPFIDITSLKGGCHGKIYAVYSGDACFQTSTSPFYAQCVNRSTTLFSLITDIYPSYFGQEIKITATIIPIGATGQVRFFSDGLLIGTASGNRALNPTTGLASLLFSTLAPGLHALTAVYNEDNANKDYSPSTTPGYSQVVYPGFTVTDLSTTGSPMPGQDVDLIAKVKPTITSGLTTGSVHYYEVLPGGATVDLGNADLVEGFCPPYGDCTSSGLFTVSNIAPGAHHYCAAYQGNSFYSMSTGCLDVTPGAALRQQVEALVTKLTAEAIESGVRVSWAMASGSAFTSLELQRSSAETGPWSHLGAVPRNEGGVTVAEDQSVLPSQTYFYRVVGTTSGGAQAVYGPVRGTAAAAKEFALSGAWPNPSRGAFTMAITLPRAANVRLSVVDLQGREVAVLADGAYSPGLHEIHWDGRTSNGRAPTGLYFVRYATPGKSYVSRVAIAY